MRFYVQYEAVKKNDDEGNDAAVPQDQKNVVLKLLMNHHAKKHSSMNIVQYLSSTAIASKAFMLYSLYYMLSSFWIILSIALQIYYLVRDSIFTRNTPLMFCPDLGLLDVTSRRNKQLCPTVDLFIPCCNEPTDIPIESVKAALALDYPQDRFKVFVLDDGADDELRAFCQALQVETAAIRNAQPRRVHVLVDDTILHTNMFKLNLPFQRILLICTHQQH
jgi:cellulose synthase/poly-beta-1,6-N-acetylglucosamine synthase-like glycosyltransferase